MRLIYFVFALSPLLGCYHPTPLPIHGHRGARAARPENTLSGFQYAVEIGVNTLEMDTVVTKDDVVVLSHDPYINREICLDEKSEKITKKIPIRSLNLREVKSFDCGSLRHPKFPKQTLRPKEKIPTLDEVLAMVKIMEHPNAQKVQFNIETKINPYEPDLYPSPEAFTKQVLDVVRKNALMDRTILQSFDFRTLTIAKELEPNLKIAALFRKRPKEGYAAVAQNLKAEIVSPNQVWIEKKEVEELHAKGIKVIPWTANTPYQWKRLSKMGVDEIITDDPKVLMKWLGL